ncbi:MAG: hypothetical protein U1F43_19595 [Myxococcota bacterium]
MADAEVRFHGDGRPATARIALRFYPWWEHPACRAAVAAGQPWGIAASDDAVRDLVVEAVEPLRCTLRADASAIDIAFVSEHPELWAHEPVGAVFCNSEYDHAALFDGILARRMPYVTASALARYLVPHGRAAAPRSLGYLPASLLRVAVEELERLGVAVYRPALPALAPADAPDATDAKPALVALLVDGEVTLVARDFMVEVPEWEHRPEWFQPPRSDAP